MLVSQSTLNLSKNADLLIGIKILENQADVQTYAGMRSTKQTGHQPPLNLETWFELQGIVNILFLEIVTKHYTVAFETVKNFFTVHLQDKEVIFRQSEVGLY